MKTTRMFALMLVAYLVCPAFVQAQITVRGKLAHDLETMAGQTVSGSIVVDNETDEPQQAKVYQTDDLFFADGTNAYDEPGTTPGSNALWVQFSPENMVVPPNGSVTVAYSISVPDSVGSGSYWSMLMVEAVDASSAESNESTEAVRQVGFRQVTRYGVQLATHLRESGERNVAFEGIQLLVDDEGNTTFQADVHNTGSLMIRPSVYMRVFGADGVEYGPFEGVQYRMYPGTSVRQRVNLTSLAPGTYQALLIVDDGDDAVFGGQYELTL